jgi:hypothetical protein
MVEISVARWPNFRPNNSKQAPTNIYWPGKIGGRKMADFVQVAEKRPKNISLKFIGEIPSVVEFYLISV